MYQLDYDLKFSRERIEFINKLLNRLDYLPTERDLEKFADYILFGQDETYVTAIDERVILSPKTRHNTWQRKDDKTKSSIDNEDMSYLATYRLGELPKYKSSKPQIRRPILDEKNRTIDPGDSDIPGMTDLWKSIDELQHQYNMYTGKEPPDEGITLFPKTSYELYQMRHALIEMRREQFFLKDLYRPTIHFMYSQPTSPYNPNLDQNTGYWLPREEWVAKQYIFRSQPTLESVPQKDNLLYWQVSKNAIDLENPDHINAILDNYAAILIDNYENLNSPGRVLCWDIELLIERANLTDEEQFMLEAKVAHLSYSKLFKFFPDKTVLQLNTITNRMVRKLAYTAAKYRLLCDPTYEKLKCTKCGRSLPKHPIFFYKTDSKKSGYCSQCRDCQKKRRKTK